MLGKLALGALGIYSLMKKNPIKGKTDEQIIGSFVATVKNVMDRLHKNGMFKDEEGDDIGMNLVFEWDKDMVGIRVQTEMENDGSSKIEYADRLAHAIFRDNERSVKNLTEVIEEEKFEPEIAKKVISSAKGLASVLNEFEGSGLNINDQFGWDFWLKGYSNTETEPEIVEIFKKKVAQVFKKKIDGEEGIVFVKQYKGY